MLNLRRAHLDDHWRKAFKRDYELQLENAEYHSGVIFDGLKVTFRSGITAIIGRNGIGKSNLIRSLFNIFATEESNRPRFKAPLLVDGKIDAAIQINNIKESRTITSDVTDGIDKSIGFMFDPCTLIPSVQNLFVEQANLEELLEGYSAVELDADDLKLINFLTHGEYQKVEVINIEDEYENFPRLPFFRVSLGTTVYDSRNMGLGELSLFYFFWLRSYMKKSEAKKILFIEEPESFLPPSAQERLADILAMTAAMEGISIILSSHSEHILKRIPRSHVVLMKRGPEHTECRPAIDDHEPLKMLGLASSKRGIALYEDVAAGLMLQSLLKTSSRLAVDNFYYHKSGSDGELLKDLTQLPQKIEDFSFTGIFDGDARGKYEKNLFPKTNFCFLPGDVAPEEVLIEHFKKSDLKTAAEYLATTPAALADAKHAAAGSDHHDYFHDIAKHLSQDFEHTLSRICDLWVHSHKAESEKFLSDLEKILKG